MVAERQIVKEDMRRKKTEEMQLAALWLVCSFPVI